MSVVIETTLGDITVDLFLSERPRACLNFLKLCKMKYYNYNLFHTISRGFIAQTGDPTGSRSGGESIFGVVGGPLKRYFEGENEPRIKHTKMGLISLVGNEEHMIGSQFFITLGEDLTYLDEKHCVFGEVVEGFDVLEMINEVICDTDDRPYQDVRITHTVILDDPFPDPKRLIVPSRSPSPSAERLQGGRIAPDEEIDEMEGKTAIEISEMQAEREAKARATILEMVGDLPDADMAPPENVLFVCKLNPVTTDDDLEIIFSRFGKIKSCEVIRDKKTGDSLQYAFVEFEDQKACENAYFKMDNVLIDDRRIHVDFSQSVSKVKWHGKGRGVTHYDEKGKKSKNGGRDIGKGNYKYHKIDDSDKNKNRRSRSPDRDRIYYRSGTNHSGSPSRSRDSTKEKRRYKTHEQDESRSAKSRYKSRSPQNRNMSPPPRQGQSYSKSSRDKSRSPSRDKNKYSGNRDRYVSSKNNRESSTPKRISRGYSKYDSGKSRSGNRDDKIYDRHRRTDKLDSYSERIPERIKNTERDKQLSRNKKENESESEDEYKKKKSKKKATKYSSDSSDSDKKSKKAKKSKNYSDSSDSDDKKRKAKKPNRRSSTSSSDSEDYKKKKVTRKKKYESDSD